MKSRSGHRMIVLVYSIPLVEHAMPSGPSTLD